MISKFRDNVLTCYVNNIKNPTKYRIKINDFKFGDSYIFRWKTTPMLSAHKELLLCLFNDNHTTSLCHSIFTREVFRVNGSIFFFCDNLLCRHITPVDNRVINEKDFRMLLDYNRESLDIIQFCNQYIRDVRRIHYQDNAASIRVSGHIKYSAIDELSSLKHFCVLREIPLPFDDVMLSNALDLRLL